jgi:hypothetical protein
MPPTHAHSVPVPHTLALPVAHAHPWRLVNTVTVARKREKDSEGPAPGDLEVGRGVLWCQCTRAPPAAARGQSCTGKCRGTAAERRWAVSESLAISQHRRGSTYGARPLGLPIASLCATCAWWFHRVQEFNLNAQLQVQFKFICAWVTVCMQRAAGGHGCHDRRARMRAHVYAGVRPRLPVYA